MADLKHTRYISFRVHHAMSSSGIAQRLTFRSSKTYTLASGDKIPAIGLGTWQSPKNQTSVAVKDAIGAGYRYIDTAFAYGNESEVGEGIRASGVPREQLWVTTKLDNPWHTRVAEGIDASLSNLGLDYVDLYLMHWPSSSRPDDLKKHYDDWNFIDTWREMQKLLGTGKVRNIGVSNFGITNLEKLLNDPSCKVSPVLFPLFVNFVYVCVRARFAFSIV
jgi:glycerol 2-dehydrogenase (NADP+)